MDLSYKALYQEFRRIFPSLGPNDAEHFITWCEQNEFLVEKIIDQDNKHFTKLFICSNLMKSHFKEYGDIVILDATYRVNRYKLPLVLFSGFTHTGRNCLFGVGIVNDETEKTYHWLIDSFFEAHGSLCKIIVTDHDLAVESVLDSSFNKITHLLCKWHIIQNLIKNFSFLTSMNCSHLKDKILGLSCIESKENFENNFEEVYSALKSKKFTRSCCYLERMYKIKQK